MVRQNRLLFIFNPRSGQGIIRKYLADIVDIFVKEGFEVTIYTTQAQGDAQKKVMDSFSFFDRIVCAGGDGTLDEVVAGMLQCETQVPIGYIPAGSTNDYAQSLELPKDIREAAYIAATGIPKKCDYGEFVDDTFMYIAGFGLFTDVSYKTDQRLKNVLGHAAYVLESAKSLIDIPSYNMIIRANGAEIHDEFVYGMITNSISVGGMKNLMGTEVYIDDGYFEVTLIKRPQGPIQLNAIIANLLMPKRPDTKYIYSFRTKHLEFECDVPVPWTLDGEYGGEHKCGSINIVRKGLTLVIEPNLAEKMFDDEEEQEPS